MTAHCKCPHHKGGPHRTPNGTKQKGRPQYNQKDSPTRYRLWQAMRVLRRFTISQIAATSEIQHGTAKRYMLELTRAGYVREVAPSKPWLGRDGEAVRILARDSGPRPPRVRVDGTIHDPNVGRGGDGGSGNGIASGGMG